MPAPTTTRSLAVHETASLTERGTAGADGRWPVQIISAGLGSSGYYSPQVLERAAANQLVKAGTPLFFDHPSKSARTDRPERSVRDIAAVFTGPATYDRTREALDGTVQVFGPYRELVAEMAPHIGLSIDGSATDITEGEYQGRRVPVIEDLFAINSVDLVTRAGRGGQFMALYEAARELMDLRLSEARNIGQWVESMIHRDFTVMADGMAADGQLSRPERIQLSSAIGDALTAFVSNLETNAPQLYQRDLYDGPESQTATQETNAPLEAEMSDEPAVPAATETAVTAIPAATAPVIAQPVTETTIPPITQETTMTDTPQGAGGTVPATEATRPVAETPRNPREVMERQIAEQGRQINLLRAENRARDIVAEVLASGWIGDAQRARLTSSLVVDLPLTEAGALDEQELRTRAQRGLDEAETEAAEILSAAGVGTPRGLGALTTPATETAGKQFDDELRESFRQAGLSDTAIDIAVKGR